MTLSFTKHSLLFCCAILLLSGCGADNSEAPTQMLTPLAYTGAITSASIDTTDDTQLTQLANSSTRGLGVLTQYAQQNRGDALALLRELVALIDVNQLQIAANDPQPTSPHPLNSHPCTPTSGSMHYQARDRQARYLVVSFEGVCVNRSTTPLIINGKLIVDSQTHSFTPDQLSIFLGATPYTPPLGSFQLENSNVLSLLYFCHGEVCKITFDGMNADSNNVFTVTGTEMYDPDEGKLALNGSQLLPCSATLGAGLDSPFSTGEATASDGSDAFKIAYSGCGQATHVTLVP